MENICLLQTEKFAKEADKYNRKDKSDEQRTLRYTWRTVHFRDFDE